MARREYYDDAAYTDLRPNANVRLTIADGGRTVASRGFSPAGLQL
jgi:hypothetical protein